MGQYITSKYNIFERNYLVPTQIFGITIILTVSTIIIYRKLEKIKLLEKSILYWHCLILYLSDYIQAGEVSAAILSSSGKIYTGVCLDTCSTLGICAERNAIFNMITNGEYEIEKMLSILPDGKTGAPFGACRELMVQLCQKNTRI